MTGAVLVGERVFPAPAGPATPWLEFCRLMLDFQRRQTESLERLAESLASGIGRVDKAQDCGTDGGGGRDPQMDTSVIASPRTDAAAVVATIGPNQIERDIRAWKTELARQKRSAQYQREGPLAIRELVGKYGWTAVDQATPEQIRTWVIEKPGSGHTQNNRLAQVSTFFRFCARTLKRPGRDGKPLDNPASAIERSPEEKGEGSREFTPEESRAILDCSAGNWKVACTTMAMTALRRGAVFRGIRVGFLDRPHRELVLPPGFLKNKKAQHIPLNGEIFDVLCAAAAGRKPEDFFVPIRYDEDTFFALLKRAGVPRHDERGRGAGTHSFRKGAATTLAENGIHPKVVQDLLGHSDIRQTMQHYTRLGRRHQAAAVEVLNRVSPVRPSTYSDLLESSHEKLTNPSRGCDTGGATLDVNAMVQSSPQPSAKTRPCSHERLASRPDSTIALNGRVFPQGSEHRFPSGAPSQGAPETSHQAPRLGLEPRPGAAPESGDRSGHQESDGGSSLPDSAAGAMVAGETPARLDCAHETAPAAFQLRAAKLAALQDLAAMIAAIVVGLAVLGWAAWLLARPAGEPPAQTITDNPDLGGGY